MVAPISMCTANLLNPWPARLPRLGRRTIHPSATIFPLPGGSEVPQRPRAGDQNPLTHAKVKAPAPKRGLTGWKDKRRGAKRGLPKRSPILVLHSPKHASLRTSDGIRCISAGMVAPINMCTANLLNPCPPSPAPTRPSHNSSLRGPFPAPRRVRDAPETTRRRSKPANARKSDGAGL